MNEVKIKESPATNPLVIIIGAGITGIASSYYLTQANIPHLILEKSTEIGGIWHSQKWPGIRCDSYIIKYSYSFKPFLSNQCLVSGETIHNYLNNVSKEFGIQDKVIFGVTVKKAVFHSEDKVWRVYTDKGVFKTNFIINANGYFSEPHMPTFKGSDIFKGKILHLFDLDKNRESVFKNKKILLVGSGASAISTVSALYGDSSTLTLLQRSPSYIYEQDNRIGIFVNIAQKLYKSGIAAPLVLVRYFLQLSDDFIFVLFRSVPWIGKLFFKLHWKKSVGQKVFEEHFQPRYNPWEQRIPISLGLKKLVRDRKIDIITGEIESFTETGVSLKNGQNVDFDLCVLATGFNLQFFNFDIFLDDQKVDIQGINFYKGMMMGGIPNYFQPVGTFHTSWTQRTEAVSKLIVKILRYMSKHNFNTIIIDRKKIINKPSITPNYVTRNLSQMPVLYGALELPSIDKFLFYYFRKKNFIFSGDILLNSDKSRFPKEINEVEKVRESEQAADI
ncbi:MAG: NAD(P)/FAD-dependent oxidoreductase [Ignavibacteriaceae bacterium]